jgi:multimeric flavodoxin WrbA
MKVITLLGSPKKNGNTASVLGGLEAALQERGWETVRFHIPALDIAGCTGCGACQAPGAGGCRQKDDCREVFSAMAAADGLVYATPLYGWDFTGQMKQFLDRHFSLQTGFGTPNHHASLAGRRAILLVTCMGPVEGNADLIQDIFNRFCNYSGMENRGQFVISRKAGIDAAVIERAGATMADALT